MKYGLPKYVEIDGSEHEIRYDYRVILEIIEALNDPELDDQERALALLQIFYVNLDEITDYDEAVQACFKFINGGKEEHTSKKHSRVMDWEQDFPIIVAPINRVLGYEIRSIEYDIENNTGGLHWWTFLSAYMEIGDCLYAQIVRIREMRAKGKPLDKSDREFYRKNRDLIDRKRHYTEEENDLVKQWTK